MSQDNDSSYTAESSPSPSPRAMEHAGVAVTPAQGRSHQSRQDLPSRLRALQQEQKRREVLRALDDAEQQRREVLKALDAEERARRARIDEQEQHLQRLRKQRKHEKKDKERRRSRSRSRPRSRSSLAMVPPVMMQALVSMPAFQTEVDKQMAKHLRTHSAQMRGSHSRSMPRKSSGR